MIRVAALVDFTLFSIRVAPLNAKLQRFRFVRALLGLGFMVFALLGLGFMVSGPSNARVHEFGRLWE